MDTSPYLDDDFTTLYQQLIGTLRWCVKLGRIDLHLPVALMAQYMAAPRVGHLDQLFHMFGYLKAHGRSKLVLDPAYPNIDDFISLQQTGASFTLGLLNQFHPILRNQEEILL